MKNSSNKYLWLSLIIACMGLASCGGNNSSSTSQDLNPNSDDTSQVKPDGPNFDNMWTDNEFENDPDLIPDEGYFVDDAPLDKGELKPYVFEFESAHIDGNSNRKDHLCMVQQFAYSPAASGNIILKNCTGQTLSFKIHSNKKVRVPLIINANIGVINGLLSSAFTITNNYHDVCDLDVKVPEVGVTPDGLNEKYFQMASIETMISLVEGDNVIAFKDNNGEFPNVDYMVIKTSAEILDKTIPSFNQIKENVTVSKYPSETETGILNIHCPHQGCTTNSLDCVLSNLNDGNYLTKTIEGNKIKGISIANNFIPVTKAIFNLTVIDGTLSDGKTTAEIVNGSEVYIQPKEVEGMIFTGWVNADDESETYGTNFIMPAKNITIKPTYVKGEKHTVTLEGGITFIDGTTSKKVGENLQEKVIYSKDDGKYIYGIYEKGNKENIIKGDVITGLNHDVTYVACLDVKPELYAPIDGSRSGKVRLYPYGGVGEMGSANGYIRLTDEGGHEAEQAKYSMVGDECGAIYHYVADEKGTNLPANWSFTPLSPFKVSASKTYTFTYTLQNLGSEDISIKVYQTNASSNPKPLTTSSEAITLTKGEVKTCSITFTGFENNNVLSTIESLLPVKDLRLGVYLYATIK